MARWVTMVMAAAALLAGAGGLRASEPGVISLIAGGDTQWSQRVRTPAYYFGGEKGASKLRGDGWRKLPFVASPEAAEYIRRQFGREVETAESHHRTALQYPLTFESAQARDRHPLLKIAGTLRAADITFLNLETPLTDRGRLSGAFRTPPSFAQALSWAGVDVVATANNHAFDAEGTGIEDTIAALAKAGVRHVGTGTDLAAATTPVVMAVKGVRVAFLAYTYGVNPTITDIGFATDERSGAAPLDPFLIKRNVKEARTVADLVVVSLHWGIENKTDVHPAARRFAHAVIDAGADVILGHHPHVPRGIEAYGRGLIAYSLGNLIFGHGHAEWSDNFLLRVTADKKGWQRAEIVPIAGTRADVLQPFPLSGARAKALLETLGRRSRALGTDFKIENDTGALVRRRR